MDVTVRQLLAMLQKAECTKMLYDEARVGS